MAFIFWEAGESFFKVAEKKMKPKELIGNYRALVDEMVVLKKRIKNPVNLKDGGPLSESTIAGFKHRVSAIRDELQAYKASIRWLMICGYWGKKRIYGKELLHEQRLLKHMLGLRVWVDAVWNLRTELTARKDRLQRLRKRNENLKELCEHQESLFGILESKCNEGFGILKSKGQVTPKKKKRKNTIGLKVLDGSKKSEDDPPFAPQTLS